MIRHPNETGKMERMPMTWTDYFRYFPMSLKEWFRKSKY